MNKPLITLADLLLAGPAFAETRPNILFIAVDDLRPEIGAYVGKDMATPHMDRLASRGMRFDRAYCMVPTCGASRASLMTGIRPASDRFLTHLTRASEDAPGITTLNTYLKDHGCTTVSLGKIFHHPDDNGPGWSAKPWRPATPTYPKETSPSPAGKKRKGVERGPSWENGGNVPDDTYADGMIAGRTVSEIESLSRSGKPFFLAVGFFKPHLPFVAPGSYFDKHPAGNIRMPRNHFPPKNAPAGAIHNSGELRSYTDIPAKGVIPQAKALELIRGYHAATSYTDAQIGRLLETVDRLGLAANTVIVLWGDHGWNLGEHTLWCKHSCFETSLRSTLIVAGPSPTGIKAGASTTSIAEFIDIYPTLCDLAGLPKPPHLQGVSLMPILRDPSASVKDQAISRFGNGDSIRTARHRYTVYRDKSGKISGRMLYDHDKDPGENVNVADDPAHAAVVAELSKRLEAAKGKPGDFRTKDE
jgi:iduronate 2-sulfatase